MASTIFTTGTTITSEWLNDVNNAVYASNKQQIFTATQGQTVFTLTTFTYTPDTNGINVYVDGLNQYGPGAQYSYTETNETTVTFNEGLHAGAVVKIASKELASVSSSIILSGTVDPTYQGNNGDFYINTVTGVFFGPKTNNIWGPGVSIIGPQGSQGPVGPAGPQGIQGIQGIQGLTGNGIASIELTSGNHAPGTLDTYTVTYTDSTTYQFQVYNGANGEGAGDVVGPASATDNALVRFNGTTGKLIQNSTVTLDDNGNVTNANAISFDTTPTTLPTTAGSLYWDTADGNKTLSLVMEGGDVVQQIGQEQYFRIKASSAITNGQVVMFTGTVGASGALTGAPATGLTAATSSYVMGIATQDIANNDWGYVTSFGLVRGLNTNAFNDGDILYLDPTVAGGLTSTIPTAPAPKVQVCAVVHKASSNGSLFVRTTFGGTLGQYEGDVNVTSPANGQLLIRNQDDGKWVNTTLTAGSGITIDNSAGGITITSTSGTSNAKLYFYGQL